MPRIFWTPARDETLRANYAILGPNPTASLLGASRRSIINRAHRLSLKAPYPQNRARASFPPQSWSPAEKLLAQALLDFLQTGSPPDRRPPPKTPQHQFMRCSESDGAVESSRGYKAPGTIFDDAGLIRQSPDSPTQPESTKG